MAAGLTCASDTRGEARATLRLDRHVWSVGLGRAVLIEVEGKGIAQRAVSERTVC